MKLTALLSFVICAGCMHGTTVKKFDVAHDPRGVHTSVRYAGGMISGELIAVDDSSLVVATSQRLIRVPYDRIDRATFSEVGHLNIGGKRAPGDDKRRELALISRYPQGLGPPLLERLLQVYHQDRVEELP